MSVAASAICAAIESATVLEFDYGGRHRVVYPYCHGVSRKGEEILRAVQVEGESRSRGFGYGKMWVVAKIASLRPTGRQFSPDDPNYNPDDSAMAEIHCRVAGRPRSASVADARATRPGASR